MRCKNGSALLLSLVLLLAVTAWLTASLRMAGQVSMVARERHTAQQQHVMAESALRCGVLLAKQLLQANTGDLQREYACTLTLPGKKSTPSAVHITFAVVAKDTVRVRAVLPGDGGVGEGHVAQCTVRKGTSPSAEHESDAYGQLCFQVSQWQHGDKA